MQNTDYYYERHKKKQKRREVWVAAEKILLVLIGVGLLIWGIAKILPEKSIPASSDAGLEAPEEEEKRRDVRPEKAGKVPKPEMDVQHLTVNPFSRPGKQVESIDKIVIHYIGNPKTSAQQNRNYFESLKDLQNASMSANYIVGLEGEIIECVPPGEVAYASNSMNRYSVSIENCHPDAGGKFAGETYDSCVKLAAYLAERYQLGREDIIRHHDVTGKSCPKYFVDHPKEWEKFRDDVMAYIEECKKS